MNDLVVDGQLPTAVVNDQHANAATTVGEGFVEPGPQAVLVNDRQALLDIARLGHSDHAAIIAHIEDTVGLEDRTKHVLDDDGGRGVRDKAGLLVKLLGEEIHPEIAMLARLGRGGDADNLARAALQDQKVTDADMVARNRDGVAGEVTAIALDIANRLSLAITNTCWTTLTVFTLDDHFLAFMLVTRMKGVKDSISGMLQPAAEGVVMTFVVVITHSLLVLFRRSSTFVFNVVRGLPSVLAVIAFCYVNIFLAAIDLYFDFGISVVVVGISVAESTRVSITHGVYGGLRAAYRSRSIST